MSYLLDDEPLMSLTCSAQFNHILESDETREDKNGVVESAREGEERQNGDLCERKERRERAREKGER